MNQESNSGRGQVWQAALLSIVAVLATLLIAENVRRLLDPLTDVINVKRLFDPLTDVSNVKRLLDPLTDVTNAKDPGDFAAFYGAGQLYNTDVASPYNLEALREKELEIWPYDRCTSNWIDGTKVNPYRNPPFYLPVVGYLATFPLPVAFVITTIIELALLGALLALTARAAAQRALPLVSLTWVAICLAFGGVWHGIEYTQLPSYIVALAFTIGLFLLKAERPFWAGLLLSLLWLKMQYVPPVVIYLIIIKEWRRPALGGLAVGSGLLLISSLLITGLNGLGAFISATWTLLSSSYDRYFSSYPVMYNWRGFLESTAPGIIPLVSLIMIALTYLFSIWAWTAHSQQTPWKRDVGMLVLALVMIIASPHAHAQDLILLLPAFALVTSHLWSSKLPWWVTPVSAGLLLSFFWLLYNAPRVLQGTILDKFKVLWLVALLIVLGMVLGSERVRLNVSRQYRKLSGMRVDTLLQTSIGSRPTWNRWFGSVVVILGTLVVGAAWLIPIKGNIDQSRVPDVAAVQDCIRNGQKIEEVAKLENGPALWWNQVCYPGKTDPPCNIPNPIAGKEYEANPAKFAGSSRCYGLAWNTRGSARTVTILQEKQSLNFGEGGWYIEVCVPSKIQITPGQVGVIQATSLGQQNPPDTWGVEVPTPKPGIR